MNRDDSGLDGVVLETHLAGLPLLGRGKVRDIYDLGHHLLIVTTDRLSAFDCILPTGIPDKGAVLTSMSRFWFDMMQDIIPNHLQDVHAPALPDAVQARWPALSRRSMIVRKAQPFPIECVARGYLAGSAWKEYRDNLKSGELEGDMVPCAGTLLPQGLVESSRLPAPVFTPATKAASGHDLNISFAEAARLIGEAMAANSQQPGAAITALPGGPSGEEMAERLQDTTLRIYRRASAYALQRGLIIADTKLEFGMTPDGVILIDEALTPDSSRFWDMETYRPGGPQPSYDKQFVRDYLETLDWNKTPPAPPLPPEIASRTAEKYREAQRRIVGRHG